MTNGMFEGLAAGGIAEMVAYLEQQLPMLAEEDQQFILGCRMHMEEGTALTTENQAKVKSIADTLSQAGHNTLSGDTLGPREMLSALAGVRNTLTAQEGQFANALALKHQRGEALSTEEITGLLNLYSAKGF